MSRPTRILTDALGAIPDEADVKNQDAYRVLVPELSEEERGEMAMIAVRVLCGRYPGVPPEVLLSTWVFGVGVGRAIERLHQAGEL